MKSRIAAISLVGITSVSLAFSQVKPVPGPVSGGDTISASVRSDATYATRGVEIPEKTPRTVAYNPTPTPTPPPPTPTPSIRCGQCDHVSATFWECTHWADDTSGTACYTTSCIENVVDLDACTYFNPNGELCPCTLIYDALKDGLIQYEHCDTTCPGGNVLWTLATEWGRGMCSKAGDDCDGLFYVTCIVDVSSGQYCQSPRLLPGYPRGSGYRCF